MHLEFFLDGEPKAENEQQEPDEIIVLKDKLRRVDTALENKLVADYEAEFGTSICDEIELPRDYPFPMALVFDDGEVLLLWLETQDRLDAWASTLTKLIATSESGEPARVDFLVRNAENHFTMTLYKCMVKKMVVHEPPAEGFIAKPSNVINTDPDEAVHQAVEAAKEEKKQDVDGAGC